MSDILEAMLTNQKEAARQCPQGWANMRRAIELVREDMERGASENEEAAARLLSEPATLEYQRIKRELDKSNPLGSLWAPLAREERGARMNWEAVIRILCEACKIPPEKTEETVKECLEAIRAPKQTQPADGVLSSIQIEQAPIERREYPNPFLLPDETLDEGGG